MDPDNEENDDISADEGRAGFWMDSNDSSDEDLVPAAFAAEEDSEDAWHEAEDDMEDKEIPTRPDATAFDIKKTGQHEYLGKDLNEVSGFTFYEENSVMQLNVVEHQTVSFPGQKMPFNLSHPSLINMVLNVMEGDKTFGLVSDLQHYDRDYVGSVGVTFQVMNCSPLTEGRCQLTGLCRQRFKILEANRGSVTMHSIVFSAKVQILPEKLIVPFYTSITANSKDRSNSVFRRKLNASIRTPFPTFVYEQYNEKTLVDSIHCLLKDMCRGQETPTKPPTDALSLSYWVASNLPLVDQQRTLLLKLDCPIQRLRYELHFMSKCNRICCCTCGQEVSSTSTIFSMSTDGPQGAYVNPDGFVHDTLTVRQANNLVARGNPSARFSWFPGYKWVCVFCHSCFAHLGWRFDSADGSLAPASFYGLTRKALVTMPSLAPDTPGFRPIL